MAAPLSILLPFPSDAPADLLLVPIPLHPTRLRWRGYNQAALLAHAFGEAHGLKVEQSALTRVRDTRSQVGLSAADRWQNVQDAFLADPARVASRAALLIDDVFTTGATLSAGAAALRQAGAQNVWAAALACAV